MFKSRYWLVALPLCICVTVSLAIACGPDFPIQLLSDPADTLKANPANSFAFEAMHLADTPDDNLQAVESQFSWYNQDLWAKKRRELVLKAAIEGLTDVDAQLVERMRQRQTGDEAFAAGDGLPIGIRLYTAGAIDFQRGNWPPAISRFEALIALPQPDRDKWAIWAAFMIGRARAKLGDIEGAAAAFQAARVLGKTGIPDPLGLAVASFGEEARLHLEAAKNIGEDQHFPQSQDLAERYRHELATAVGLYAQQAAHKSNSGIQSLRIVAQTLLKDDVQLSVAVTDDETQRLLVAFALACVEDVYDADLHGHRHDPILATLIDAIDKHHVNVAAGGDRLAALAYRIGEYDLAKALAGRVSGPLADWVKAKIAFQDGDLAGSAAFYSKAARYFPEAGTAPSLDANNQKRLIGEQGVLSLARGEYVDALDRLYAVASTYWGDVVTIAERVLTVDELKAFVEKNAPHPSSDGVADRWPLPRSPATELRDLLARRLVRVGRYQEALPYFDNADAAGGAARSVTQDVADYASALKAATSAWFRVDRARAYYRASVLARRSGMEMMGYEGPPDFFVLDGQFNYGVGQEKLQGPQITDLESQRFAMTAAVPDKRFHYRFIAVDQAVRSADLLPPRSQAFAAVLCHATRWIIDREPDTAKTLYERYVRQGAHVSWGAQFGRVCPEPDFDEAARLTWLLPVRHARHFVHVHLWEAFGIVLLMTATIVVLLRVRRAT